MKTVNVGGGSLAPVPKGSIIYSNTCSATQAPHLLFHSLNEAPVQRHESGHKDIRTRRDNNNGYSISLEYFRPPYVPPSAMVLATLVELPD